MSDPSALPAIQSTPHQSTAHRLAPGGVTRPATLRHGLRLSWLTALLVTLFTTLTAVGLTFTSAQAISQAPAAELPLAAAHVANSLAAQSVVAAPLAPAIQLTTTVGAVDGCATTTSVRIVTGSSVYLCYTVTNSGDVTFTQHFAIAEQLIVPKPFTFNLGPGQTVTRIVQASNVQKDVQINAGWQAITGTTAVQVGSPIAIDVVQPRVALAYTVGLSANECGTATSLLVPTSKTIYFCLRITNSGDVNLTNHEIAIQTPSLSGIVTATLAPGDDMIITQGSLTSLNLAGSLTQNAASSFTSSATVTARTQEGLRTAPTTATIAVTALSPTVTLQAIADTEPDRCRMVSSPVTGGTPLYYCLVITNASQVQLTRHIITLPLYSVSLTFDYSLKPGERFTLTNGSLVNILALQPAFGPYGAPVPLTSVVFGYSGSNADGFSAVPANASLPGTSVTPTFTPIPTATFIPTDTPPPTAPPTPPTPTWTPFPPTPTWTPTWTLVPPIPTPTTDFRAMSITTPVPNFAAAAQQNAAQAQQFPTPDFTATSMAIIMTSQVDPYLAATLQFNANFAATAQADATAQANNFLMMTSQADAYVTATAQVLEAEAALAAMNEANAYATATSDALLLLAGTPTPFPVAAEQVQDTGITDALSLAPQSPLATPQEIAGMGAMTGTSTIDIVGETRPATAPIQATEPPLPQPPAALSEATGREVAGIFGRVTGSALVVATWLWLLVGSLIFFAVAGLVVGLGFRQSERKRFELYDLADEDADRDKVTLAPGSETPSARPSLRAAPSADEWPDSLP